MCSKISVMFLIQIHVIFDTDVVMFCMTEHTHCSIAYSPHTHRISLCPSLSSFHMVQGLQTTAVNDEAIWYKAYRLLLWMMLPYGSRPTDYCCEWCCHMIQGLHTTAVNDAALWYKACCEWCCSAQILASTNQCNCHWLSRWYFTKMYKEVGLLKVTPHPYIPAGPSHDCISQK